MFPITSHPSLAPLIARYDAFLVDLWGVIHDGSALYAGVKECLSQLRDEHKRVLFLSNAPRRAANVISVLEQLGVDASLYDQVVSSGEVAYHFLARPSVLGEGYYFMGPDRDAGLLTDLPYYRRVSQPAKADFILNAGFEHDDQTLSDLAPILETALERKLMMICINPDMEIVKHSGQRLLCAGAIAAEYESRGGAVIQFGKPYPEVYTHCLTYLRMKKSKILAVGDNLDTDIRGANSAGIDSALVLGGILKEVLKEKDTASALENLCHTSGHTPTFTIPHFRTA